MIISSAGITVPGKVRTDNQDNFYINGAYKRDEKQAICAMEDDRARDVHVFAVCDGMGGYSHGERASLRALEVLGKCPVDQIWPDPGSIVRSVNRAVCEETKDCQGELTGTTIALVGIRNGSAFFCNVGDSRIYRMRDGQLSQVSVDHTQAQNLVNAGIIDAKEARKSKASHMLSQHLGIPETEFLICPEIRKDEPVERGDLYLLCSDGLSSTVDDERLQEILRKEYRSEPKVIASRLILEALDQGGKDNITAVVVKAE